MRYHSIGAPDPRKGQKKGKVYTGPPGWCKPCAALRCGVPDASRILRLTAACRPGFANHATPTAAPATERHGR